MTEFVTKKLSSLPPDVEEESLWLNILTFFVDNPFQPQDAVGLPDAALLLR